MLNFKSVDSGWLPLFIKYRFTAPMIWLETTVISFIAWLYLRGDIVDYTQIRCDAYHLWRNGYTVHEISKALAMPDWLVRNWVDIWNLYVKVMG